VYVTVSPKRTGGVVLVLFESAKVGRTTVKPAVAFKEVRVPLLEPVLFEFWVIH
jgi:hypothetical protein